ncbi:hypothetical protein FF38_00081 [Lucilia cuprina]|uniref:Uncharacterized protein n=1 Tax=Lucilia cuprina TaxID=7375 RepID=A0A0L0BL45_LUCCU|nr:hypothetical protein FF38_00081 [Lucilia cuprina]
MCYGVNTRNIANLNPKIADISSILGTDIGFKGATRVFEAIRLQQISSPMLAFIYASAAYAWVLASTKICHISFLSLRLTSGRHLGSHHKPSTLFDGNKLLFREFKTLLELEIQLQRVYVLYFVTVASSLALCLHFAANHRQTVIVVHFVLLLAYY